MFWPWLLKYSSFLITGIIGFASSWILLKITTRLPHLISYTSTPQWVPMPPQQEPQGQQRQLPAQQPPPPVGTFTLFLINQGKAPAKDVHVGHFGFLPAHSVYPDIPREIIQTPGGGHAIRFPTLPKKVLVSISYLYFGPLRVDNIISYIGSEDGSSKHVPVMLQRIMPKWFNFAAVVLVFVGMWVMVNAIWSLTKFLWVLYYR